MEKTAQKERNGSYDRRIRNIPVVLVVPEEHRAKIFEALVSGKVTDYVIDLDQHISGLKGKTSVSDNSNPLCLKDMFNYQWLAEAAQLIKRTLFAHANAKFILGITSNVQLAASVSMEAAPTRVLFIDINEHTNLRTGYKELSDLKPQAIARNEKLLKKIYDALSAKFTDEDVVVNNNEPTTSE